MGLFPKERDLSRPLERVELEVDPSAFGAPAAGFEIRLDAFLSRHLPWRSRAQVQALVREGYVLVAASAPDRPQGPGEPVPERRPGRRLRAGSRVVIVIPEPLRVEVPEGAGDELAVLFEDEFLLAVDKPPFVAVHPSHRHVSDSLIHRVHVRYRADIEARGWAPKLCHRLDRETSGIVLCAREAAAHREMMRQFEAREVEKEYLAIVHGRPEEPRGVIDLPLGPARASRIGLKMACVADGLPSRTDWELVRSVGDVSLVRCRLHSGRQHQIRVHLAAIGHPLVGDKLYGVDEGLFQRHLDGELSDEDRALLRLPRHALHHARLVVTHPRSGERLSIESPLAPDLARYLDSLEGE